jgi:hypothetical protein
MIAPPSSSKGVSSPTRCEHRASARSCHTACSGRPRGFSPPRRVPPPPQPRACCVPLPTMGFTGFPFCLLPQASLPLRCSCPPERSPPEKPCHTSPWALAPSSFTGCAPMRPRGLALPESPLRLHAVASIHTPEALLGFPSGATRTLSLVPGQLALSCLHGRCAKARRSRRAAEAVYPNAPRSGETFPPPVPGHVYGWRPEMGSSSSPVGTLGDAWRPSPCFSQQTPCSVSSPHLAVRVSPLDRGPTSCLCRPSSLDRFRGRLPVARPPCPAHRGGLSIESPAACGPSGATSRSVGTETLRSLTQGGGSEHLHTQGLPSAGRCLVEPVGVLRPSPVCCATPLRCLHKDESLPNQRPSLPGDLPEAFPVHGAPCSRGCARPRVSA